MTNDKTVTMSRELIGQLAAYASDSASAVMRARSVEARRILAAPVVERPEVDGPISELSILRATCKQLEEFRDKVINDRINRPLIKCGLEDWNDSQPGRSEDPANEVAKAILELTRSPVAIALPTRKQITGNSIADVEARAHNACLDKFKEMNK